MLATLCLLGGLLAPAQAALPAAVPRVERRAALPPAAAAGDWLVTPRLTAGQEIVYRGTFIEQAMGQHVQLQRGYRLENRVFVLEAGARGLDLAVLTLWKDEAIAGARPAGRVALKPAENLEARSVHLERVRIDQMGRPTPPPGVSLAVPLEGPPPLECGFCVAVPAGRIGVGRPWTVTETGRPETTWHVAGMEVAGGISCLRLEGVQQSDDWDHPRGGSVAWRRRDAVWISPRNGMAQRVDRRIEHRLPGDTDPSAFSVLRYELQSQLQLPVSLAEERRREVTQTTDLQAFARPLLAEPARNAVRIDGLLLRVRAFLGTQALTPYREALVHLEKRFAAARRGETPPELPSAIALAGQRDPPARTIALGRPAPDFVAGDLTAPTEAVSLRRLRGKPVLMLFFNPASHSLDEVMDLVQGVTAQHSEVVLVGVVMTEDRTVGQLKAARGWKMPVLNGTGLRISYAVDCTPKIILIDADGVVQGSVVGWGSETPSELEAVRKRWLRQ